jgi:hypothetical protein
MFLTHKSSGYDLYGQQFCSGKFLMFMQPKIEGSAFAGCKMPIRCLVRHCSMRQLGNFMMGLVRVKGDSLTVSGAYGHDGLPMSVAPEVYELGAELPSDLHEAWNKGGGWNGAGNEAPSVRAWAKKTFNV